MSSEEGKKPFTQDTNEKLDAGNKCYHNTLEQRISLSLLLRLTSKLKSGMHFITLDFFDCCYNTRQSHTCPSSSVSSVHKIRVPLYKMKALNVITVLPLVTSSSMRCKAFSAAAIARTLLTTPRYSSQGRVVRAEGAHGDARPLPSLSRSLS